MLTGKLFFNLLISAILEGFSLLLLVLESFKFFFKPVTKFIYFIHENELVDRQCWFSSFVYIHVCTGLQYLVYLHVLSNVFASNYFYKDFLSTSLLCILGIVLWIKLFHKKAFTWLFSHLENWSQPLIDKMEANVFKN